MPRSPRHTRGPNRRPHVFSDEIDCHNCGETNQVTAHIDFVQCEAVSRYTCWLCKASFTVTRAVDV